MKQPRPARGVQALGRRRRLSRLQPLRSRPDALLLAPAAQARLSCASLGARATRASAASTSAPAGTSMPNVDASTARSSATLPSRRCSRAAVQVMHAQHAVAEPEASIGCDARRDQPAQHRRIGVAHHVVVQQLDVDLLLLLQIESIEALPLAAHVRLDRELARRRARRETSRAASAARRRARACSGAVSVSPPKPTSQT